MMGTTELLAAAGLKCTKQRKIVLEILADADKPLTAEEIYDISEGISLSTVYRTIDRLLESGVAVRTTIPKSDGVYYELIGNEHKHYAICLECHKLKYIDICPLHETKLDNFTVTGHKIELYGYCSACRSCREPG